MGLTRRSLLTVTSVLMSAATLSVVAPAIAAAHANARGALFGPFSTLGSPLGCGFDTEALCLDNHPLATMDARGEATLVWVSDVGPSISVESASIAPGNAQAGATRTLSHGRSALAPALAVTPAGQTAVAWLQVEQRTPVRGSALGVSAVQLRERLPGGQFTPAETVWRAAGPESFLRAPRTDPNGEGDVQIAMDEAGDEVIAWETAKLMVATRSAHGRFTAPVVLGDASKMAYDGRPAVAMDPTGRATVLWSNIEQNGAQLLASTWAAGSQPPAPTVLDEARSPQTVPDAEFQGLRLSADAAGDELAAWLKRLPLESIAGFPPAAMSLSWRAPDGTFGPPQTLTAASVTVPMGAEEPTIALRADGRALAAWVEVNGFNPPPEVGEKKMLDYSTAARGGAFGTPTRLPPPLGEARHPAVAWLADGTALIAGKAVDTLLAAHSTPEGGFLPAAVVDREWSGSEGYTPVIAAGGGSDPVIAWAYDRYQVERPVQYAIANGLDGPTHAIVAPTLGQLSHEQNVYHQHGVFVVARCAERCRVNVTVRLFRERASSNGARVLTDIGVFRRLRRTLPANRREVLKIRASRRLLQGYCGPGAISMEVRLSVRGLRSGLARTVTEGGPVNILGGETGHGALIPGCPAS